MDIENKLNEVDDKVNEIVRYIKKQEIDQTVKGWFVSKAARNAAYATVLGIAFISFSVGAVLF